MKKHDKKPLAIQVETIRQLSTTQFALDLEKVAGGRRISSAQACLSQLC